MAAGDEDEDVVAAMTLGGNAGSIGDAISAIANVDTGNLGSGFMSLFSKFFGGIPAQGHTKFEKIAHKLGHSFLPVRVIDKTEQGKKFNALSLLEQGKITSRNELPFQKQILEDGTYDYDLTDPTIQAVVGGIPMRSHLNYGLDEYRASKPGFGDADLNPQMFADKRHYWDMWLLTGQKQYLDMYNYAESDPKFEWA